VKEEKKEKKKLIIDEDWKEQARKEKEVMMAQEQAEQQKQEKVKEKRRGPLPRGDFAGLVSMLATQALFAMGAVMPEGQEKKEPDLELAKYHIDMLESLEVKTKGNLSEQEAEMLSGALHQLRMLYVKVSE
jgi:hypothetical protein